MTTAYKATSEAEITQPSEPGLRHQIALKMQYQKIVISKQNQ